MAALLSPDALVQMVQASPSSKSISSTCRDIGEWLSCARGETLRSFFRAPPQAGSPRAPFQVLLSALFALDEAAGEGWLAFAAAPGRDRERDALKTLLSTKGPLLSAVAAADADGNVRYSFLPALLPPWAWRLSQHTNQFSLLPGRYFLFWAALYAARPGVGGARSSVRLAASEAALAAQMTAHGTAHPLSRLSTAFAAVQSLGHAGGAAGGGLQAASGGVHPHPFASFLCDVLGSALPPAGSANPAATAEAAASGIGGLSMRFLSTLQGGASSGWPLMQATPEPKLASSPEELVGVLRECWLGDEDVPTPLLTLQPQQEQRSPFAAALVQPHAAHAFSPGGMSTLSGGLASLPRVWAPALPWEDRVTAIRLLVSRVQACAWASAVSASAHGHHAFPFGMPLSPRTPVPSATSLATPSATSRGDMTPASLSALSLLPGLHAPLFKLIRRSLAALPSRGGAREDMQPLLMCLLAVICPPELACTTVPVPIEVHAAWSRHFENTSPFFVLLPPMFIAHAASRAESDPAAAVAVLDGVLSGLASLGAERLGRLRGLCEAHNARAGYGHGGGGDGAVNTRTAAADAAAFGSVFAYWDASRQGVQAPTTPPSVAHGATSTPPKTAQLSPPPPRLLLFERSMAPAAVAACVESVFASGVVRSDVRSRIRADATTALGVRFRDASATPGAGGLSTILSPKRRTSVPVAQHTDVQRAGLARRLLPEQVPAFGDLMLRPLCADEVGPLARFLVRVSLAANAAAGLGSGRQHAWLDPSWRINLRPLAEKQVLLLMGLAWLALRFVCLVFSLLHAA